MRDVQERDARWAQLLDQLGDRARGVDALHGHGTPNLLSGVESDHRVSLLGCVPGDVRPHPAQADHTNPHL